MMRRAALYGLWAFWALATVAMLRTESRPAPISIEFTGR
jgi:hypothetical protein